MNVHFRPLLVRRIVRGKPKTVHFSFWPPTLDSTKLLTFSFRNQDIISHLVKLLSAAVREIVGTEDENDHDGINMIDIAEGCTGALQNMAKDRESRELIRNMNIIPAVCDLMCIDHQETVMLRKLI